METFNKNKTKTNFKNKKNMKIKWTEPMKMSCVQCVMLMDFPMCCKNKTGKIMKIWQHKS